MTNNQKIVSNKGNLNYQLFTIKYSKITLLKNKRQKIPSIKKFLNFYLKIYCEKYLQF